VLFSDGAMAKRMRGLATRKSFVGGPDGVYTADDV
jgi:hypothetical protein